MHAPQSMEDAQNAKRRLTFDEALLMQLLLAKRRSEVEKLTATPRSISTDGLVAQFETKLPFKYTDGQKEVNSEIEADMKKSHPMH